MIDLPGFALLFGAGLLAGTLNVIAGGGSFLTLPILIFLGLSPTLANGTNRVALVAQNIGATWAFGRHKMLDWDWALVTTGPAVLGAVAGTWAALHVSDQAFQRILASVMIVVTLATLLGSRWSDRAREQRQPQDASRLLTALGFLVVGLYGGFIQAGVGFLILTVTTLSGFDLVRGNAIKALVVLLYVCVSLVGFAYSHMVDWEVGVVLAGGMLLGGQLGVRLAASKGHDWIRGVRNPSSADVCRPPLGDLLTLCGEVARWILAAPRWQPRPRAQQT